MDWAEVIKNPMLRNLPFKIELNRLGQLLMTPASNLHGNIQAKVGIGIQRRMRGGEIIYECSIRTSDGVKVADVAWASDSFVRRNGFRTPYTEAPEICVEIASPSNTEEAFLQKSRFVFGEGCRGGLGGDRREEGSLLYPQRANEALEAGPQI